MEEVLSLKYVVSINSVHITMESSKERSVIVEHREKY